MGRFVYEEVEDDEQEVEEEEFDHATSCNRSFGRRYDANNSIVSFPLHQGNELTPASAAQCRQDTHDDVHNHQATINQNYDINGHQVQQAHMPRINVNDILDVNHVENDYYLSHYHDSHPSLERQHRHQRRSWMKQHCIIILMLITLQRYTPPPPPPNETWNEFISTSSESCVSIAQNLVMLALYISSGCIHNIYGDLKSRISTTLSDEKEYNAENVCSIVVPGNTDIGGGGGDKNHGANNSHGMSGIESSHRNGDDGYNNGNNDGNSDNDNVVTQLMSKIFGQNHPLRHIVEKVREWNNDREFNLTDTRKNHRPLSMIFTGAKGVGKYATAMRLADILLEECEEPSGLSDSVLTLSGLDYALEDINPESEQSMDFSQGMLIERGVVQKILDHIYHRQGSATVIIIKHVENISSKARSELTRLWNQSRVTFKPTTNKIKTDENRGWMTEQNYEKFVGRDSVELSLVNVAFICTTDLGVDKLFEVLLKSSGIHDLASYSDIKKATQDEISQFFDNFVFDAVAPFWPLRYWDMLTVIDQMIQGEARGLKFKNIDVHESAARYFINPKRIDYFEFKLTDGSYLFSKNGAKYIMDGVRNVLEQIEERIVASSFYSQDDIVLLEYDENSKNLSMKLCSEYGENENLCSPEMRLVPV